MRGWLALTVLAATLIAGCHTEVSDPIIDGWPIGAELACTPDQRCPELLTAAIEGFDRRDPGHAVIVNSTLHIEGLTVDAEGNILLHVRSGSCCSVARFELADGTTRAIGAGFPGISREPVAVDYGP